MKRIALVIVSTFFCFISFSFALTSQEKALVDVVVTKLEQKFEKKPQMRPTIITLLQKLKKKKKDNQMLFNVLWEVMDRIDNYTDQKSQVKEQAGEQEEKTVDLPYEVVLDELGVKFRVGSSSFLNKGCSSENLCTEDNSTLTNYKSEWCRLGDSESNRWDNSISVEKYLVTNEKLSSCMPMGVPTITEEEFESLKKDKCDFIRVNQWNLMHMRDGGSDFRDSTCDFVDLWNDKFALYGIIPAWIVADVPWWWYVEEWIVYVSDDNVLKISSKSFWWLQEILDWIDSQQKKIAAPYENQFPLSSEKVWERTNKNEGLWKEIYKMIKKMDKSYLEDVAKTIENYQTMSK